MKRIVGACIEQTLCFDTSKEANPQENFKHFRLCWIKNVLSMK